MGQRVLTVRQHTDDKRLWDIGDFLALLPTHANQLTWMMRESECLEFVFKEYRECPSDALLTYQQLTEFTNSILQSVWCTYLADASTQKLEQFDKSKYLDHQTEKLDIEFAFEAVDSSYWLVTARDKSVLDQMEKEFLRRNLIWRGPDA